MSDYAHFAYAQARLQARHGLRPNAADWRRLESNGDLATYLQAAQRTTLRPWVVWLHASHGAHQIELSLREHFRAYIDEIADWLPRQWRASVRWAKRVVDLPALHYLLGEATPLPWMHDDPALRDFALGDYRQRLEAIQHSDCALIAVGWQGGKPVHESWLQCWQNLWPKGKRFEAGLYHITHLFRIHFHRVRAPSPARQSEERASLAQALVFSFRRYSAQPASAYAHLALVALDVEVLRGNLVRRALFSDTMESSL